MLIVALLIIGIASRFVIEVPNFTPIAAIALLGGAYLSRRIAILLPLAIIMISDLMIGLHDTMVYVWTGFIAITLLGIWLRGKTDISNIFFAGFAASLGFYLLTNLGVWMVGGLYPKTLAGLMDCYAAGIPFFRNFLISTAAYSLLFFGTYEWVKNRLATRVDPQILAV